MNCLFIYTHSYILYLSLHCSFSQDPTKYSTADSQIMQDLQKLTDKLNLLEDLISNEDTSSLQGLLQNPTIGQMYQNCRNELPKLLELTNSDGLNEDLMNKIINITERLMKIKSKVEGDADGETCFKTENNVNEIELLHQSTDQLIAPNSTLNIFDDLPLLSPNPSKQQSISIHQGSFQYNNDLLIDSFQLSGNTNQSITRIMNISTNQIRNIKLDGKSVKSKIEPFETFITVKGDLKSIEYNENESIELVESRDSNNTNNTSNTHLLDTNIENLLLI